MFLSTDDPALKRQVVDQMASAPQHMMASAAADMFTRDAAMTAAACQVPLRLITAGAPRSDLEQLRELCPQLVVGQTVGAGHFTQQLVPGQVHAMIERFLTLAWSSPGWADGRELAVQHRTWLARRRRHAAQPGRQPRCDARGRR